MPHAAFGRVGALAVNGFLKEPPGIVEPGIATVNAAMFFKNDWLSARAAHNWRSEILITPCDDISPFSLIRSAVTGLLDGSTVVTVTDGIELAVQVVNLLDEVTRTGQVFVSDGTRVTRSAFRNDRRFVFLARFVF